MKVFDIKHPNRELTRVTNFYCKSPEGKLTQKLILIFQPLSHFKMNKLISKLTWNTNHLFTLPLKSRTLNTNNSLQYHHWELLLLGISMDSVPYVPATLAYFVLCTASRSLPLHSSVLRSRGVFVAALATTGTLGRVLVRFPLWPLLCRLGWLLGG